MAFNIVYTEIFLSKFWKLDKSIAVELEKKVEGLKENAVRGGQRMHHAHDYYRIYLRNFRLIYKIEGNNVILFDIIKRGEGYFQFRN